MRALKLLSFVTALVWATAAIAGQTLIKHRDGAYVRISSTGSSGSTITIHRKDGTVKRRLSSALDGQSGHKSLIRKYRRSGSTVSTSWDF